VTLKPELASFDAGSINLGGARSLSMIRPFSTRRFDDENSRRQAGIEIFDLGMLMTALRMREEGKLDDPLYFQFVLGPMGAPATPKSLLHLYEHLPPHATWSTIGIGKDPCRWP